MVTQPSNLHWTLSRAADSLFRELKPKATISRNVFYDCFIQMLLENIFENQQQLAHALCCTVLVYIWKNIKFDTFVDN